MIMCYLYIRTKANPVRDYRSIETGITAFLHPVKDASPYNNKQIMLGFQPAKYVCTFSDPRRCHWSGINKAFSLGYFFPEAPETSTEVSLPFSETSKNLGNLENLNEIVVQTIVNRQS
jgi:hypothetical protein